MKKHGLYNAKVAHNAGHLGLFFQFLAQLFLVPFIAKKRFLMIAMLPGVRMIVGGRQKQPPSVCPYDTCHPVCSIPAHTLSTMIHTCHAHS